MSNRHFADCSWQRRSLKIADFDPKIFRKLWESAFKSIEIHVGPGDKVRCRTAANRVSKDIFRLRDPAGDINKVAHLVHAVHGVTGYSSLAPIGTQMHMNRHVVPRGQPYNFFRSAVVHPVFVDIGEHFTELDKSPLFETDLHYPQCFIEKVRIHHTAAPETPGRTATQIVDHPVSCKYAIRVFAPESVGTDYKPQIGVTTVEHIEHILQKMFPLPAIATNIADVDVCVDPAAFFRLALAGCV